MLFGNFAESQSKDFSKEGVDEEGSVEDYGYLSDSDLEDEEHEKVASFKRESEPIIHPFDPFASEDRKNLCEKHKEHVEKGKAVKVLDMAFVT